jgi:hypothetical protein
MWLVGLCWCWVKGNCSCLVLVLWCGYDDEQVAPPHTGGQGPNLCARSCFYMTDSISTPILEKGPPTVCC